MVERQREMGKDGGVVLDGRDIGTAVFPDAEIKFFLDANPGERAQRRLGELRAAGTDVSFDAIEREVRERDYTDTHRAESPLVRAWDAIALDTTKLGPEEVVERMLAVVGAREGKPVDLGRLAEAHRRSPRRYLEALRTAGLSTGLYRLRKGEEDEQAPHAEEEAYLVLEGTGRFQMGDENFAVGPGLLFTVPARSSTASTRSRRTCCSSSSSRRRRARGRGASSAIPVGRPLALATASSPPRTRRRGMTPAALPGNPRHLAPGPIHRLAARENL
jgi:mannose-6-phosphate isomerase-like protein (cupin superfamily)